ncbi:MAG: SMC-Scp complex subunit ScpB [Gammaproteobacteria bacterium]|nr:SMC-Scp complex subunit ScpB [Gammaproteobacteria bacterium]
METELLKKIIVSVLLSASEPLTVERLALVFEEDNRPDNKDLKELLAALCAEPFADIIEIKEVASGFRAQIKADYAQYIIKLWEEKPARYTRAFLETLVLIAYRQPVTRAEIEDIRGVAVNGSIIKTLFEREWIRVVGHKELPGRPELLATTKKFLDYFNLKSLDELPTLDEIHNLDKAVENLEQALEIEAALEPVEKTEQENTFHSPTDSYEETADLDASYTQSDEEKAELIPA